jgi:hypothetical protein
MTSQHKLVDGVWYKWEMPKPVNSPYMFGYLLAVGRDNLPKELRNRLWHEEDWQKEIK